MSDRILLARTTDLEGVEIKALVEYDDQYNDWVGFVSLNGMVPFDAGKPFKDIHSAKYFAMEWFNRFDSEVQS